MRNYVNRRIDPGERAGVRIVTEVGALHGLRLATLATATIVLALAMTSAIAQPRYVRLVGMVQWIAGEKLMLAPANGSTSIPVDLTSVPLDQYRTLAQREYVVVTGVVSEDNRGIDATSVTRTPDWYYWDQQAP